VNPDTLFALRDLSGFGLDTPIEKQNLVRESPLNPTYNYNGRLMRLGATKSQSGMYILVEKSGFETGERAGRQCIEQAVLK
jgi:hypothetical protein